MHVRHRHNQQVLEFPLLPQIEVLLPLVARGKQWSVPSPSICVLRAATHFAQGNLLHMPYPRVCRRRHT
ncbi:hypothetical protein CLOP_g6138 [Closterium sp. NIES-67]|nr:hypothetical protein CLOP_g6138 [Closterium sp. NIES-67]